MSASHVVSHNRYREEGSNRAAGMAVDEFDAKQQKANFTWKFLLEFQPTFFSVTMVGFIPPRSSF